MKKLNLGCGPRWKELYPDYEGLDIVDYGQAYVTDVIKFLTGRVPDESYDEVMANHFLEHFDQDQLRVILSNIHRILKKDGALRLAVPHKDKDGAWDLAHKTFWNENTVKTLQEMPDFGRWRIKNVVTNTRKDIHAWLIRA